MYEFETEPYDHQRLVFDESWRRPFHAWFLEMGTGKTKVALDNAAALFEAGEIDSVLIIAPKGVYDNWTFREIPMHLPARVKTLLVRWQPNKTKGFEAQMLELVQRTDKRLRILVMNVEALSTKKGAMTAFLYLENHPKNMVIVDESTTIKNRKAARTSNILKCGRLAKFRRILTGSPITKSPMDLFSQCEFLSREALGHKSYYGFQQRYAVVQRRTLGHRSFQEITGYRRLDELGEKLEAFSHRILKEDCLDLPEKVYVRRNVDLSDEQERVYKEMKKFALAQMDAGELATTTSILTQIMRLQQIVCGFLPSDEDGIKALPNNRLPELLDTVEEVQGKAIIWAAWVHNVQEITEALRRRFGPESAASFYGETPQDERQETVDRFQDPDSPLRFFVGTPRTGGYGLTLTAANTVIYYANNYDLEIRLQSEDRAHRIGQEKSVTYIDIVAEGTIDEKILDALREKSDIASAVLGEEARKWFS
tara:strand:+ start:8268 stop:9710 length:1443 start_codon:yes stop_codon:yes gene_type:complete